MKKGTQILMGAAAAALLGVLSAASRHIEDTLGNPAPLTGWILFSFFVFLGLFNVRKKLSMLPLGNASTWLFLHLVTGLLSLAVFWLHTGTLWPQGLYEQILAGFFYFLTLNGLIGYVLQRIYPLRLTESGLEIIYERIPDEISAIREQAEALILECAKKTSSGTLAQHYLETLDWYFRRPRFFLSHAMGGQKGISWIHHQFMAVKRYLNEAESVYLEKLVSLAELKNGLDLHYAVQGILKGWLFFHVPLTAGLMVFVLWHIGVVHIYAL